MIRVFKELLMFTGLPPKESLKMSSILKKYPTKANQKESTEWKEKNQLTQDDVQHHIYISFSDVV